MYRPMHVKKEQFVKDIAEAVAGVIKDPKYSALAIGGDTKQTVIEHISTQLDGKIAEGKEKAVDRILDHVKRTLMDAPQFEYNHNKDTGDIVFTYHEPQKDDFKLCTACDGVGHYQRKYYTTVEKVECPKCKGAGRIEEEWGF